MDAKNLDFARTIVKRLKAGERTGCVARDLGISTEMVRCAVLECGESITDIRREVGRKIALEVKRGDSMPVVADRYNVSVATVRLQCLKSGIPLKRSPPEYSSSSFEILAQLLAGKSQSDAARKANVSRQRVEQIAKAARKAGILLPTGGDK